MEVGFITVVMAPMWHMALHNTNLYSLGHGSLEASGLNLFILFSGCHLGHCNAGILLLLCLLLGHLGLYSYLGLYIFVAIWACTTLWAIWACTYLLPLWAIARPANKYYYVIY